MELTILKIYHPILSDRCRLVKNMITDMGNLVDLIRDFDFDYIGLGIESRGFILASAIIALHQLGKGVVVM